MQKLVYVIQFIQKLLPPRRLRFPLLGLILVVGIVADRSRPVQSSQFDPDPYTYRIVRPQPGVELLEIQPNYGDEEQTFGVKPNWEQPDWSDIAPGQITSPTLIAATSPYIPRSKPNPQISQRNLPQGDGIYLYGQSPRIGENGKGYIVFTKNQGRVVGALYMPNSEYSCFRGSIDETGAIAMTVQGYAGESNPVQVATSGNGVNLDINNINAPSPYAHSLSLTDFYRLQQIGQLEREILQACEFGD
ncbi:hypothetical protein [Calothrix sp. NIES-3974]|uniref:hypothetical protein n=1 Tax=Calothrix sp. NIES-3974 TaxID=2005462 RepID=UPI000B5FFDF8|nr:hypothetical protein [Calothrix sp. NIES-3974]BAZ05225.1 hypothetical protein NIES3974_18710 [Calothrix sp. NIES-3974]